jgi:hypothetical protein
VSKGRTANPATAPMIGFWIDASLPHDPRKLFRYASATIISDTPSGGLTSLVLHLLDIGSSSKYLFSTSNNDSSDGIILVCLVQLCIQVLKQGGAKRVLGLGSVQSENDNIVGRTPG